MLHTGLNSLDGIPVEVVRKRVRRISLRVDAEGVVHLNIPSWGATIAEGVAFLRSQWKWCVAARAKAMARRPAVRTPPTKEELAALVTLLGELQAMWTARLAEPGVTWHLRRTKRRITYNSELARAPRELVEYVVVHELTHLQVHDHGPRFHALMNDRLPGWPTLRRRLNNGHRRNFLV